MKIGIVKQHRGEAATAGRCLCNRLEQKNDENLIVVVLLKVVSYPKCMSNECSMILKIVRHSISMDSSTSSSSAPTGASNNFAPQTLFQLPSLLGYREMHGRRFQRDMWYAYHQQPPELSLPNVDCDGTIENVIQSNMNFVKHLNLTKKLDKHSGCVNSIQWTSEGPKLITGSDDCEVVRTISFVVVAAVCRGVCIGKARCTFCKTIFER
jgi:hypothetical protein